MNSAIVVFLDSIDKANEVVEHGIIVKGELISVLPLSLPAKKVTISNVPPFVSDLILTQALSRYGKMVSPIKKIPINCSSPLLKHIVSFRRFAYMIINDDADLDVSLNFRIDDFDYVVFVTTAKMKCFRCGTFGHLMRNCPEIIAEKERNVGGRSESGDLAGVSGEAEGAPPGEGSVAPAEATPPPASSSETVEGAIVPTHAETRSDEGRKDVDGQADRVSENSAEHFQEMYEIAKCCGREEEQAIFKTPQKRKKSNEVPDAKASKKIEMHDDEDLETESDAVF
ncbi:hypothetical protein M9458_057798 [Cirrhinus mrigala]|uniref:CCHC-type domain-containing protein n=1 Tax=Cirrhinus mrigala TaxID=683832 RepID=A0ABD0MDF7_CIRMR